MLREAGLWVLGILLVSLLFLFGYVLIRSNYLDNTEDLPYKNLSLQGRRCFIYFNVEHRNNLYTVVTTNANAMSLLMTKSGKFPVIYPYYLYEVIKNECSISLNDSLFNEFKDNVIDKKLQKRYEGRDILNDTSLIVNQYRINHNNVKGDDLGAIIYVLIQQGINCCEDDETGAVIMTRSKRFIRRP